MNRARRLAYVTIFASLMLAACNPPSSPTAEPAGSVPEEELLETDSGVDTSAVDPYASTASAERLQFAPDATSIQREGILAAGESVSYVLHALGGQSLFVQLPGYSSDEPYVVLTVTGQDGTQLLVNQATAIRWEGLLPTTQDYLVSVISNAQTEVPYALDIIIPPLNTLDGVDPLTIEALANAKYRVCDTPNCTCQMSSGLCLLPAPVEGLPDQPEMRLSIYGPNIAFGDMNGDGLQDALVILDVHTPDTTGFFKYAALVLNQDGQAHNAATWFLGDRASIDSVAILSGVMNLQVTLPPGMGSDCCNPETVTYHYSWDGEALQWAPCPRPVEEGVLSMSDRCSIVLAVRNSLANQDSFAFEALLSESDGINYITYIEGGQPVTAEDFLNDLSQRLGSHPTCDFVRMDEAGETLQIWTSGWTPPWEIHYYIYDAIVTVEPPWTSQIAAFLIGRGEAGYELRSVWLNEDNANIWETGYGLKPFSCSEVGIPEP